jgi:predicted ribosome quality control (RQC) complex YloA/Tae2 family protein
MKKQLNSADIYFLAKELNAMLSSSRIDKAYQLGEKELKLKIYAQGTGSLDLILAPDYICVSRFPRKAPETPSSFAMQLRKHLGGAYIREIRQHGFDRIIEIVLEREGKKYTLLSELFSRGNIMLCNEEGKILGLMEWQKWKDRKLGVSQNYEYPPAAMDPFILDFPALRGIVSSSGKKVVSVLATDAGIGGTYAEEVCMLCGVDKDRPAKELSNSEVDALFDSFSAARERIRCGPAQPNIVYAEGKHLDVAPLDLTIYRAYEKKAFPTFNEAVDEYFSKEEFTSEQDDREKKYQKELAKLEDIESKQKGIIERFEKDGVDLKADGDIIYQKYAAIEQIISTVKDARSKGYSWEDISGKLSGKVIGGLEIEKVSNEGFAFISVKK